MSYVTVHVPAPLGVGPLETALVMSMDGMGAHAWSSSVSPAASVSRDVLLNARSALSPSGPHAVGSPAPDPAPSSCSGTSATTVTSYRCGAYPASSVPRSGTPRAMPEIGRAHV